MPFITAEYLVYALHSGESQDLVSNLYPIYRLPETEVTMATVFGVGFLYVPIAH